MNLELKLEGQTTLPRYILEPLIKGERKTANVGIPYANMAGARNYVFSVKHREQDMIFGGGCLRGTVDTADGRKPSEIRLDFTGENLLAASEAADVPLKYKISEMKVKLHPDDDPSSDKNLGKDW